MTVAFAKLFWLSVIDRFKLAAALIIKEGVLKRGMNLFTQGKEFKAKLLTDFTGKTVEEVLKEMCIPYFALSKVTDLLPIAYQQQQPGERVAMEVENEFHKYGAYSLKLIN